MKKASWAIAMVLLSMTAWAAGSDDAAYVNVTGDTMTGPLTVKHGKSASKGVEVFLTDFLNAAPALRVTTKGTGSAGMFKTNNPASTADALSAETGGIGSAGSFAANNPNNPAFALSAVTRGSGSAGYFAIKNPSSRAPALTVVTNGTGHALTVGGSADIDGGVYIGGETNIVGAALIGGEVQIGGILTAKSDQGVKGKLTVQDYVLVGTDLTVNGDAHVGGVLYASAKNFVQPHPSDPSKEIVYVAMEGPESAVFLRGTAKLADGKAIIETPDCFKHVASDSGITVQFTPRSADSNGLAAVGVAKDRIEVVELMKGKGTYEFDYFITAKRVGFEAHAPIAVNSHFSADNLTKAQFEKRYSNTDDASVAATRSLLIANGILTADGRLNEEVARELGWKLRETEVAAVR
jgi:hypothetical protein